MLSPRTCPRVPSRVRGVCGAHTHTHAHAPVVFDHHTMAVLLATSTGDIVIDLHVDDAPVACRNFLKLAK